MLLSDHPRDMFLVGGFPLALTSSLLNDTSLDFLLDSTFCSLKPLSFDQFSVAHLLVLLGLLLNNGEFVLLEYFHACLLQCLLDEHVEHRLHL